MTESMIERVERVIGGHVHGDDDAMRAAARAAIEAMKVPTEAMIDAACAAQINLYPAWEGEKPQPTAGDVVVATFTAMITAALSEKP